MRLDKYLSEYHSITRNRAQFLISEGLVSVNGKLIQKASFMVGETDSVEVAEDRRVNFVSRSAIKLDTFLDEIGLGVTGMICLDIGASTGGFTQVLLERGAARVVAVDVGTSQLHDSIRSAARVLSIENTDIRDFAAIFHSTTSSPTLLLEGEGGIEYFDLIVGDISFISLTKLMDSILALASAETEIILLYKPQFEVGKENLRKTGVPKTDAIVQKKFAEFQDFLRAK